MRTTPDTMAMANKVLDYIETYPERHDQSHWVARVDMDDDVQHTNHHLIAEENICNTKMCIAGTAVFLSRPFQDFKEFSGADWEEEGARLLGLDEDEADALFYSRSNEGAVESLRHIANGNAQGFALSLDYDDYDED